MPIEKNSDPWRRAYYKPGVAAVTPTDRLRLHSAGEIQQVVRNAVNGGNSAQLPVRACGSHWAFSDAALSTGTMIETQDPDDDAGNPNRMRIARPLNDVIPRGLTHSARRFFESQNVKAFDPASFDESQFSIIHVEAGMLIAELYSTLDGGDHTSPAKHTYEALSGIFPNYEGPWAMATLGGAGGQTVAGAISTGTHGGDVKLPAIGDALLAVHLIGARGEQYWIEKELEPCMPLIEESALRHAYGPDIKLITSDELMRAVTVAVGRFGVIYSVVLKVVRQFALHEERSESDWSQVRPWINDLSHPVFNHRFVQVLVNPMGQFWDPSEHDCYLTVRNDAPLSTAGALPKGRTERSGDKAANSWPYTPDDPDGSGAYLNRLCQSNEPVQDALDDVLEPFLIAFASAAAVELAASIALALPVIPPPGPVILAEILAAASIAKNLALGVIVHIEALKHSLPDDMPLGTAIAIVANALAQSHNIDWMRIIWGKLMAGDQAPRKMDVISYAAMDIHSYLDTNCLRDGDSIEVFFDASSAALGTFMDLALQRIEELERGDLTGDPCVFPGYMCIRYMHITDALIGMQKWGTTCSIEIACLNAVKGTQPYLAAVERDALALGATLHWGQRNNMTMREVEACYDPQPGGLLYRWRKQLSDLTRNGRDAAFSTPFTKRTGLEVVQPKIGAFAVAPDMACAGSLATVTWNAEDNPPGTVVWLEVLPLDPGGSPASVSLPALAGSMQHPLPAGRNEFRLVAEYALNKRILSDTRSVECRGMRDGETWRFQLPATCLYIDGAWRWGVNIAMGSSVPDDLMMDGLACRFAGAWTWYARRAGEPDLEFSWLQFSPWQTLSPSRKLRGDWYFFLKDDGCKNPRPDFWAEFRVACQL